MKKLLLAVGLLALVGLVVPRPADAHVGIAIGIGLPGFGFFAGSPYPPVAYPAPVVYPAPVYYPPAPYYYYAPAYAAPGVVVYGRPWRRWHRGWYPGRWRH